MITQSSPIGMFDSGIGGLTVMQQLVSVLPHEDVIYFGDTARLPYGGKSRETIIRYSIENAIFLIEKQVKIIVVACNTAASHGLEKLRQIFNVPILGVIDPGVERALEVSAHRRIAVLGTKGTIQSGSYQEAILKRAPGACVVPIPCPLFAPLVEEGWAEHPAAEMIVREYLRPAKEQRVDTVLLGCTHYPLLKRLIHNEMGEDVAIVDSASSCAESIAALLNDRGLKNGVRTPAYRYFVSDDPQKFQRVGSAFLGVPIQHVELV